MPFDRALIDRLSPHAVDEVAKDIPAALERIAVVEGAQWRPAWTDLYFPGIPDDLRADLLSVIADRVPPASPYDPTRLAALRALFDGLGIDALLVPRANEHRTEDLPTYAKRLEWITGFTGSAGTAMIARDSAWLFIDGRYVLQAAKELDSALFESRHFQRPPLWEFLGQTLPERTRIGYDARLHSSQEVVAIEKALADTTLTLVPLSENPIDRLWTNRPPKPFSAVVPHPIERTGVSSEDKRAAMAADLLKLGARRLVLSQLDSIAWAFNIRGGDTAFTPVVESHAIIHDNGQADLFVETRKLSPEVLSHLGKRVSLHAMEAFEGFLGDLGGGGATVALDLARTPKWIETRLASAGARIVHQEDPTEVARLRKTTEELNGFREAMTRDGVAMVRFMRWFSEYPLDKPLTEMMISEKVTAFRAMDPTFRGPSFATIVGSGPNGAVIHYHPTKDSDRVIEPGDVIVLDSGGQYLSGTTDITRTLCRGTAGNFERSVITAVLSCHATLASTRFPMGTTGTQLDGITRANLWAMGIEYDHGTGHGIGSFLAVHEGAIRISKEGRRAILAGNVLSNEPGAYLPGRFGCRHENAVVAREGEIGLTGETFLEFETLTAAPFPRDLILVEALSPNQVAWLDAYHAFVLRLLSPHLEGADLDWLKGACAPL